MLDGLLCEILRNLDQHVLNGVIEHLGKETCVLCFKSSVGDDYDDVLSFVKSFRHTLRHHHAHQCLSLAGADLEEAAFFVLFGDSVEHTAAVVQLDRLNYIFLLRFE